MPTTASAAQDALAVPEILANIFSNLSALDLTRTKMVSRTFDFVSSDWQTVREANFVQADYTSETRKLHIFRYVRCFFQHSSFSPPQWPGGDMASYAMAHVVDIHPLLKPRCTANHTRVSQMELDFPNLHVLLALHAGGSWKQALLTQPPICRMAIEVYGKLVGPGFGIFVQDPEGLRLGKVVEALRAHMPEIPSAKSWSKGALKLRKHIHVIGVVPNAVSASSSLVSQAEMFRAADSKAQAKWAKKMRSRRIAT